MRSFVRVAFVSALLGLAGCGDEGAIVTDPTKLAPLTEEQKAEIARQDAAIDAEESDNGGIAPAQGKPRRPGVAR